MSEIRFEKRPKSRVIVLADITNELDDEESMVRFLVCGNGYDVEGLIDLSALQIPVILLACTN